MSKNVDFLWITLVMAVVGSNFDKRYVGVSTRVKTLCAIR